MEHWPVQFKSRGQAVIAVADKIRRGCRLPPPRLLPLCLLLGAALQAAPAWAADAAAPEQNLFQRLYAALHGTDVAQAPGAGGAAVPPVPATPKVEPPPAASTSAPAAAA